MAPSLPRTAEIVIIGAGAIGASIAYHLARRGARDVVVDPAQSSAVQARLPQAELVLLDECGHAPHWHDGENLRSAIRRYQQ